MRDAFSHCWKNKRVLVLAKWSISKVDRVLVGNLLSFHDLKKSYFKYLVVEDSKNLYTCFLIVKLRLAGFEFLGYFWCEMLKNEHLFIKTQ